MKINFLGRFSKNTQISNFMKIGSVGAELFYADGQIHGQKNRQTDNSVDCVSFKS